jgi:hypothetical protein
MKSIFPLGRAEPTKSARNDEFTRVVWVLEIAPNPSWLSKLIIMAIKKINTQVIKSNYLVVIYNRGSQSFFPKSNIRLNPPGLHRFFHENLAVL